GPRAVLVHLLDGEVALVVQLERQLVEDVVLAVAHGERLLRALLVVDDDLHGDLRATREVDPRRMLAVPHDLARRPVDRLVVPREELLVHRHPCPPFLSQIPSTSADCAMSNRCRIRSIDASCWARSSLATQSSTITT